MNAYCFEKETFTRFLFYRDLKAVSRTIGTNTESPQITRVSISRKENLLYSNHKGNLQIHVVQKLKELGLDCLETRTTQIHVIQRLAV